MKNLIRLFLFACFILTAIENQTNAGVGSAGPTSVTTSAPSDTVGTAGSLGALNNAASVAVTGQGGVGIILSAGTLIGTLTPEISYDGGTTWVASLFYDPTALATSPTLVFSSANGNVTRSILISGGASNARVRVSAYTSGSANATLRATANSVPATATGIQGATPGAAAPAGANSVMDGWVSNNLVTAPHICGSHIFKHITTISDTQILPSIGSQTIYVCDYSISFNGTGNIFLEKSTTGTCGTPTQIDMTYYGVANSGKNASTPFYKGLNTGASAQLCANTSAAIPVDIAVDYDQY